MKLIRHIVQPDEVIIETSPGFIKLTPCSDCIVRVCYTLTNEFSAKESLMIQPTARTPVEFQVHETTEALIFSIPQLSIRIDKQTAAFTYVDSSGRLLTKEPARGGKTLTPVNVVKTIFDESAAAQSRQSVDGERSDVSNFKQVIDRQAYHTKREFEWAEGEALYGLGSHEEGMLNLRGQHQYLYQQNMKVALPVLLSTRGYGLMLDNYSSMTFRDDAFGSYLWTDIADELDYYFIYGPEFDQIIHGVRQLTGQAPMLPKWAFGYIQSKERYKSQDELIAVAKEYRSRGLPLDCIVLDWQSWPEGLWGQKTLDPERFPDPPAMTAELHRLKVRLMVSIWPHMSKGGANWLEMREKGCLLGNQSTYDAFSEKARQLYWRQANEGLFAHGIDAWWCDCTEPFEADWKGPVKLEPEERLRINTEEAKKYLDPAYINAYSLLHSKGIYEGQRNTTTTKRVVNLTRSAYPGQQRYSTITWSGDITATWETLRRQIPAGLNFCATGLPYWTLDIGAFFVKNRPDLWFWSGDYDQGVEDLGYRELFMRWFQFGAFLPMFRTHGTDTPREIWRFGEPGDVMYDTLVKYLRLRYRLLPYIYSLAGQVTHKDYTMLRALPFDFRHDPATYNISDQFMFGPALLVNPVTQPMYYGVNSTPLQGVAKTRPVYLPTGSDWYDFWTGVRYSGGQTLLAEAPLSTMPLYARSGSIIPIGPDIQSTAEQPNVAMELWVYPGQDGSFMLYEDEGDNYNYEKGAFATIPIRWEEQKRRLVLEERAGSYPGMPETVEFKVMIMDEKAVGYDSNRLEDKTKVIYEGRQVIIDF
jgi:alpha-D-xyloside xylohydrolase